MEYTSAQLGAITHKDGPMMVLAGPGSGKTMVITGRTRTLIEEYGIPPEQVLVITFTKAAAIEMRERFTRMMGAACGVRFSTFHSLFFLILRAAYGYQPEQIIREDQQYAFLREQVGRLQLETGDEKDFVKDLLSEISLVKSEEIDLNHYYSMNCPEETFKQLYQAYDAFLREQHLIDFDDMMLLCKELFSAREDILSAWQQRCRYILIDEFQDINRLQYGLIRQLAAPENNLFIVGDDDQSIYRFRGAKPEIMLQFPDDYPSAKQILLDRNYRSTEHILTAAGRVIVNNHKRFPKQIQAAGGKQGPPPSYLEFPDRKAENHAVAKEILALKQKGIPLPQIAVLYRTNLEARSMAETLMAYNIPFTSKEAIPNLYEHWISRNILSYLRLARLYGKQNRLRSEGEPDEVTVEELSQIRSWFLDIMNRPNRYLTRESMPDTQRLLPSANQKGVYGRTGTIANYIALWKTSFPDKNWMADRLDKLELDLRQLSTLDPYAGIHYIRHVIGYDEFLKSYSEFRRISLEDLTAQIDELQDAVKSFSSLRALEQHMDEYAEELRKQRQNGQKSSRQGAPPPEAVSLSTMHASKGLEYQAVFLPDAVEGITPYKKALKEEDLEEERRLFYVALTRAKQYLYVITIKSLFGKPQTPSRFVGEMKLSLSDLKPGARILHKSYGTGTIQKISGGKLTIYFDSLQKERVLDLNFCVCHQMLTSAENGLLRNPP